MRKNSILFIVILAIAVFLRIFQLDIVPSEIHADEADTTYTAYSILKTGKEPHGNFNLFALGDNNTGGTHAPLYTFLQIPFVKILGVNFFSARLPSAILGVLTVVLFFFILKKVFNSQKISFLGMFLLAFNPWAIHISRQGLGEAIALFFILLGTTIYLYSEKKVYMYILSGLFFGLSVFSYDAPKIFLPPFIGLLVFFTRDKIFKIKHCLSIFLIIILFFYCAMLKSTFFDNGLHHFSRASVFDGTTETVNSERFLTKAPLWLSSIVHNKISVGLKKLETSYANVFSLNWFFVNGSNNLQRAVGNHGQFYLFELPFFFIGIYFIFKKDSRLGLFLLAWMMIGALPGGLTTGNYAYRSVLILPVPIIFSTIGMVWVWELFKKNSLRNLVIKLSIAIIMAIYIFSYLITYFFDYPVYASEYWNKQQNQAIQFISSKTRDYQKIFVDGGEPWAIYYAFFNNLDPKLYQEAYLNRKDFKNSEVIKLNNVYFGMFNLESVKKPSDFFPKNSLVVTNAVNFSKEHSIRSFNDPGRIRAIFKIFEVK